MHLISHIFPRPHSTEKPRPWLLEFRSSTSFIISTVTTAVFTDIFLYAVIVPVFPFSLVERIGVPESDVQYWLSILLSVYGAGLLVAAPILGWVSDRIYERRVVLLSGILVLGAATVMLCFARNLPLLIVGRLLQGAAAGTIWVVGLALLADTVGKESAGQAMGYVAMGYSFAALVAPLLGGIVYERAGYYSVFGMAFGMIGLDIVMRLLLIEKKIAKQWLTLEQPIEIQTVVEGIVNSKSQNINSNIAKQDRNSVNPDAQPDLEANMPAIKKIPPFIILLKSRRMQATFWASTVDAMLFTAFDVTLPLFVKDTFHWSSVGGGLIFLALLCPTFIQPLFGHFIDKHGPRWIAGAGMLICVLPYICLRFVTHDSMSQKVLLCALLFFIGLGVCLTLAAAMAEFTYICAEKEEKQPGSMGSGGAYAQSYSFFNVSWALGCLIGSYWAGGVKDKAGWGAMGWSLALLCAVISVPTFMYVGGSIFQGRKNRADAINGVTSSTRDS